MYRLIHTKIDQDDWYLSLDLASKGLYLSLIVSSATNQLGVIKNSTRYLCNTLGITEKELEERLGQLSDKVLYLKEQNIIYIKNFVKYQAGSVKSNKFLRMAKKIMKEATT